MATYEASLDSFMTGIPAGGNNTNYGSTAYLLAEALYVAGEKSALYRAILEWDISDLIGETVTSATIRRYVENAYDTGEDMIISRCTRPGDIVEGEVTWNSYSSGNSWTSAGGDYDDGNGTPAAVTYQVAADASGWGDITGLDDIAQDALDNRSGIVSVIVRVSDEEPGASRGEKWTSKEGSDAPLLIVHYEGEPGGLCGRRAEERGVMRGFGRGVM